MMPADVVRIDAPVSRSGTDASRLRSGSTQWPSARRTHAAEASLPPPEPVSDPKADVFESLQMAGG